MPLNPIQPGGHETPSDIPSVSESDEVPLLSLVWLALLAAGFTRLQLHSQILHVHGACTYVVVQMEEHRCRNNSPTRISVRLGPKRTADPVTARSGISPMAPAAPTRAVGRSRPANPATRRRTGTHCPRHVRRWVRATPAGPRAAVARCARRCSGPWRCCCWSAWGGVVTRRTATLRPTTASGT